MFGGLLPSSLARSTGSETHVTFSSPGRISRGIKVIYIASGFAATELQIVKQKKLEILVKFGVAAPRPWGEGRNLTPRER